MDATNRIFSSIVPINGSIPMSQARLGGSNYALGSADTFATLFGRFAAGERQSVEFQRIAGGFRLDSIEFGAGTDGAELDWTAVLRSVIASLNAKEGTFAYSNILTDDGNVAGLVDAESLIEKLKSGLDDPSATAAVLNALAGLLARLAPLSDSSGFALSVQSLEIVNFRPHLNATDLASARDALIALSRAMSEAGSALTDSTLPVGSQKTGSDLLDSLTTLIERLTALLDKAAESQSDASVANGDSKMAGSRNVASSSAGTNGVSINAGKLVLDTLNGTVTASLAETSQNPDGSSQYLLKLASSSGAELLAKVTATGDRGESLAQTQLQSGDGLHSLAVKPSTSDVALLRVPYFKSFGESGQSTTVQQSDSILQGVAQPADADDAFVSPSKSALVASLSLLHSSETLQRVVGIGSPDGFAGNKDRLLALLNELLVRRGFGKGGAFTDSFLSQIQTATDSLARVPSQAQTAGEVHATRADANALYRALVDQAAAMRGLDQTARSVRIEVDPPHLGPVSARMELNGSAISLTLTVNSAAVRQHFENQLMELRNALMQQGFEQVNIGVEVETGGESKHTQADSFSASTAANRDTLGIDAEEDDVNVTPRVRTGFYI